MFHLLKDMDLEQLNYKRVENNIEIKIKDDKSEIITYKIKVINNELEKEGRVLYVSNYKKKFYKIQNFFLLTKIAKLPIIKPQTKKKKSKLVVFYREFLFGVKEQIT